MCRVGLAVIPSRQSHPAPPGHPERYEKLSLVLQALEEPETQELTQTLPTRSYDPDLLQQAHTPEYIANLKSHSRDGFSYLDPDTYRTATSFGASCDVTWALLSGVDEAFTGDLRTSLVLGRPPGHHAETDRAMGFCLVNHIAVAAQYALNQHQAGRVAIVDFDIHHGNGSQHTFYERSDVLYTSTHQYPFYPGTGSNAENGSGEGEGFTINFPLPAGTGDAELIPLFEKEILPALRRFGPGIILVSAGFDGHRRDPLGGFDLTGHGYRSIAAMLKSAAAELCGGRLVSVLEGGYDPEGNRDSITNYIRGLAE